MKRGYAVMVPVRRGYGVRGGDTFRAGVACQRASTWYDPPARA